jgi:membrane fusion protein (multidrug efflux system)
MRVSDTRLCIWLLAVLLGNCGLQSVSAQSSDPIIVEKPLLELIRRVPISTEVAGRLISVTPSDEGAMVKAGDELIRLDDGVIQAQVNRAQVQLDLQTEIRFAEVSLEVAQAEKQQKLEANERRPGAFSPSEIRQVDLEVKKGDASLKKAMDDKKIQQAELKIKVAELEQYTVNAPFDGMVTMVKMFPGQNVRPGEQVLELTDMSVLRAQLKVPREYLSRLFVGDPVEFQIVRPGGNRQGQLTAERSAANQARAGFLNRLGQGGDEPPQQAAVPPATAQTPSPRSDPAAETFRGEIRFIDPVIDTLASTQYVKVSVLVQNRQDEHGRYLLYQGLEVRAKIYPRTP